MADNPIGTVIGDEIFEAQDADSITFMNNLPAGYKDLPLPQQKAFMANLAKLMAEIAGKKITAHVLAWERVTVAPTAGDGLDRPMPSVCQQFDSEGAHVAFWFKVGDGPKQWDTIGGGAIEWEQIQFDPSAGDGYEKDPTTIVWQISDVGLPLAIWVKSGTAATAWSKLWPIEWERIDFDPSSDGYAKDPTTIVWQVDGSGIPTALWAKDGTDDHDWSKIWPITIPPFPLEGKRPFALYQFWRGQTYGIKDSSGNQVDLAMGTGSETYDATSSYGTGFKFSDGRYLKSDDVSGKFQTLGDLSIVISFQITSLPAVGKWGCILTIDGVSSGVGNCLALISLSSSGKLSTALEYTDGTIQRLSPDTVLSTGTLYHLVLARKSDGSITMYLNGASIGSAKLTAPEGGSASKLNVGAFFNDYANSQFSGLVGSLSFYASVLSNTEASILFHDEIYRWGTRASAAAQHAATHAAGQSDALSVTESMLSLADNTTCDVGTDKHGLVPKRPGDATKYLGGDGLWSVPYTSDFTTAYEVNFTTLAALNLMTGGDGAKTMDGKAWQLVNSANLQTAYLNNGTYNGLYLRGNANNSGNQGATLSSGAVYIALSTLAANLSKYQLHREIWVWGNFTMPHAPNANYEILQMGLFAGTPYTAANMNRMSVMNYYSGGSGWGHTHLCLSGVDSGATGGVGSSRDCFAIRIIDGTIAETYYGSMVAGAWPAKSAMTRSARAIFGTTGMITRDNWYVTFACGTGNNAANADMLIAKLKIEYK